MVLGNKQFLLCTAKTVKGKIVQGEPWEKNRASVFCFPGPVYKEELN